MVTQQWPDPEGVEPPDIFPMQRREPKWVVKPGEQAARVAELEAEIEALKRDRAMLARVWAAVADGECEEAMGRGIDLGLMGEDGLTPAGQRLAELGREG